MKKIVSIALCAVFVCVFINANANIKRVGFSGTPITNQDYSTLQAANDAATTKPGDTILIFPGAAGQTASFSKKLVIIGYGYFNNVTNDSTKANKDLQNIVGSLDIIANLDGNADSSIFEGINSLTIHLFGSVTQLTIKRCIINFYSNNSSTQEYKGVRIFQSYINTFVYTYTTTGSYFSNLWIENSYVGNFNLTHTGGNNALNKGILINNVIASANFYNGDLFLTNNILLSTHNNDAICTYAYNIANNAYPLSNNGNNKNNKNYSIASLNSDFFVGYSTQGNTSDDGRWQLKAGSQAKNAGILADGVTKTDCGMFGGIDSYKLSGIPPIPSFYKLTAPANTADANPYTITFSVRGNN